MSVLSSVVPFIASDARHYGTNKYECTVDHELAYAAAMRAVIILGMFPGGGEFPPGNFSFPPRKFCQLWWPKSRPAAETLKQRIVSFVDHN